MTMKKFVDNFHGYNLHFHHRDLNDVFLCKFAFVNMLLYIKQPTTYLNDNKSGNLFFKLRLPHVSKFTHSYSVGLT